MPLRLPPLMLLLLLLLLYWCTIVVVVSATVEIKYAGDHPLKKFKKNCKDECGTKFQRCLIRCSKQFSSARDRDSFGDCSTDCDFDFAMRLRQCNVAKKRCSRQLFCTEDRRTTRLRPSGETCDDNSDCASDVW